MNIRSLFKKSPNIQSGLHHFEIEEDGYRSRIHLRIDPDGHGTLIVNANRVIHLNPSAAFMAYLILEGYSGSDALRAIRRVFRVSKSQAEIDLNNYRRDLNELVRPDSCPVCVIDGLEIAAPFSTRPSAPYRMDLALTYRCNNDCSHCYNARPRDYPEIDTNKWIEVIDQLWDVGIPHIVFTGGEPTLREDLPELIAHAEKNGQITGLNTNARRLRDPKYINKLVDSGLDHIQITVESHDPQIHDLMVSKDGAWRQTISGLQNALDSPLFVMTNTTMLKDNSTQLEKTLDFLGREGVPTVGLNALIYSGRGLQVGTGLLESQLPPLLELAREKTDFYKQRLIWYTPTQYCQFDPTQLELGIKGCTAGLYNMCIEPDGGVIPCQSYYHQVGRVLEDNWESIWNHEITVGLRERKYVKGECLDCLILPECGGGCPLALRAQKQAIITIDRIPIQKGI